MKFVIPGDLKVHVGLGMSAEPLGLLPFERTHELTLKELK